MSETATLTVVRRADHPNRVRAYRILLDGKEVGVVKNGQTFATLVPPGSHALLAKVDWVRSTCLQFTCAPGAAVFVHCHTSTDPLEILKATLGRPSTHITLTAADSASLPVEAQTPEESRHSAAHRAKRAALWFVSVMVLGLAFAVLVDSDTVPDALNARRQELIGQASGFVAILGALWTFLRRPRVQ